MFNLNKKNIIVTGGLGILGKTLAKDLASLGANVIILDIQDKSQVKKNHRLSKI